MRNLIIASIVTVGAALSFAAPSQAGYYGDGYYGSGYQPVDHYYGHKRQYYKKTHYKRHCWTKKVRAYDYYGDVVIRYVKVCE